MAKLKWDQNGERVYETGVDKGVLYVIENNGNYGNGVSWNGLTEVAETPSGGESNKQYADNRVYANLKSNEEFGGTINAFTYPDEFEVCDGSAVINGVSISQQARRSFGFSYRTLLGNDTEGTEYGYKTHLVYGAEANPSEKTRSTVNDSPEAATLSWEFTTTAIDVPGTNPATGKPFRPTAHLIIDSTKTSAAALAALEDILYGTEGADSRLPLPEEVLAIVGSGSITEVTPTEPAFDPATDTITIPTVVGVQYLVDDEVVAAGPLVITEPTMVEARALPGYRIPANRDTDWGYDPAQV